MAKGKKQGKIQKYRVFPKNSSPSYSLSLEKRLHQQIVTEGYIDSLYSVKIS